MTRKKLGFMNVKEDADPLNRDEMRSIMAGSGGSGCDPWEVYNNCTQTAYQNYQNGHIGSDLLVKFYDDYCKASAASCG